MGVDMPAVPVAPAVEILDAPAAITVVEPATVTLTPVAPVAAEEILAPAPVAIVTPLETGAPVIVAPVTEVETIVPPVEIETQPLNLPPLVAETPANAVFAEGAAAQCTVSFNGSAVTGADCTVLAEEMAPGSSIAFVNAADPSQRVTTTLSAQSVAVPTRGFLNQTVVSDGVGRLQSLLSGLLPRR
jgi:hypothetical protein